MWGFSIVAQKALATLSNSPVACKISYNNHQLPNLHSYVHMTHDPLLAPLQVELAPGQRTTISSARWPGIQFAWAAQDLSKQTSWRFNEKHHIIVVHLSGPINKIETEVEGTTVAVDRPRNGDVWIIPAGHCYHTEARGGVIRYGELFVDEDFLKGLVPPIVLPGPIQLQTGGVDPFLHRGILRLAELTGRSEDLAELAAASLAQTLMLHFFHCYPAGLGAGVQPRAGMSASTANLLSNYILEHLDSRITLPVLCDQAKITPHELLITFRRTFGTTPAQYVITQRLNRAKRLLLGTSKSLAMIAAETGFSSHAHLTSCFSKRVGITPTEFRNSR
jgi:AraC family transcriptional regulator